MGECMFWFIVCSDSYTVCLPVILWRGSLPQHISDRGGGGRDHDDWWLEDGVHSLVQKRGHL